MAEIALQQALRFVYAPEDVVVAAAAAFDVGQEHGAVLEREAVARQWIVLMQVLAFDFDELDAVDAAGVAEHSVVDCSGSM